MMPGENIVFISICFIKCGEERNATCVMKKIMILYVHDKDG